MPALLMSRSMVWSPSSRAAVRTLSPSVTSMASGTSLPRELFANFASCVAVFGLRQQANTLQPSVAYWRANSRPIPRFAPVIRTASISIIAVQVLPRSQRRVT